ncbi:hypothetical protein [Streptomyces sp. NPDC051219]|uniref:hypothetical protein n=1 Tax=Streptomyces sp. NPDC051219 TaxID=3155283 RepID=UPI0034462B9E
MLGRTAVITAVAAASLMASACGGSLEAAEPKPTEVSQKTETTQADEPVPSETELDADVDVVRITPSDEDPNYAVGVVKVKNRGDSCPVGAVTVLFYDENGHFYTEGVNHFMELGKGKTATVKVEAFRVGKAKKAEVVEVVCQ